MKVTLIQTTIALVLSGIAVAHENYGQKVLDKEVSVQYKHTTLKEVLSDLERKTSARFVYSASILDLHDSVTMSAIKEKLGYLLEHLFNPRGIQFEEQEHFILLTKLEEQIQHHIPVADKPDVIPLTGKVINKVGDPLPGVNVVIKGTTIGTATDAEGNYSIVANTGDILVFSFIGFKRLEIAANSENVLNVTLEEDVSTLNEIVINAGYWTVTDQERTGNISRITADEIARQPVSNPLQALTGRLPGVSIQQTSGMPGGAITIQIRGTNSVRLDGNEPFYIVDGVPFTSTSIGSNSGSVIIRGNPLSSISPNDIESIEILKDADATAIYGSRGANGVVLITTKKGKAGKSKLDMNIYQGAGKVTAMMDMLNTQQYIEMRKEAYKNDNRTPTIADAPDLLIWDTTRYTDWQKEFIGGTAQTTNARLAFSGGNMQTQFLMSGEYFRETTVFPGDFQLQRGAGNMNINHQSSDGKFKASVSSNFTSSNNNLLYEDFTWLALMLAPNSPALYNENGELNWENNTWDNPLAKLLNKYQSNTTNFIANANLNYEVLPGLHFKTAAGFNDMRMKEVATHPSSANKPDFQQFYPAWSDFSNSSLRTWNLEPQIDYRKKIGKGLLNLLIGTTFQESIREGTSYRGTGFASDVLVENPKAATTVSVNSSDFMQYRYAALFGRINYTLNEKYIVNLTGRRDGSSRFGSGRQFANFGAIGAAWIFSNESFIKDALKFLTFGKLRTSFGTTGSDQIGNYQYLDLYRSSLYPYNGATGLVPDRLANPDYAWEINKKYEAGLELGFTKDRIFFSASWYRNTSSNQLVGLSLPLIAGFSNVQYNLPATVRNAGLEFELTTTNLRNSKLAWTTALNLTVPRNKLVEFPNIDVYPAYSIRYVVGQPLSIAKVYDYTGVNLLTGTAGFKDVDGDGKISLPEDSYAVNTSQDFFGGLNNTFDYGGFRLDVFFQFVKQNGKSYVFTYQDKPGIMVNQPQYVMRRWQKPGDITDVERFAVTSTSTYIKFVRSDAAFVDASFIRLKNVSLSYQLPTQWVKKAKMQSARVYIQGQNLLTFTDYLGIDPENQNATRLPPLRVLTVGFQLTL